MELFEYNNEELQQNINKFELMISSNKNTYFDVYQFEEIIDYYIDTQKINKAYTATTIATNQHPNSNILKLKQAQLLVELGKTNKALKILNYLEKVETKNIDIYFFKGLAFVKQHNNKKAIKYFDKALNISEEDETEDMLQIIAQMFQKNMDYKLAIIYLKKLIKINPFAPEPVYDLAMCYLEIFDYKNSEKYFNIYLDFDAFSKTAWLYLGESLKHQNKKNQAIRAYDYAIAIDPKFIFAYINKANILADDKKIDKAIDTYKDCLFYNKKNAKILTYLGELYEENKNYELALETYKKAIDIDKNLAEAWFGIGIINYYKNDLFESLFFIKRALKIDPENSEFLFYLGKLNEKLGFYNDAIDAYILSDKILPNQDETKIALANILTKNNNTPEAIKILKDIDVNSDLYSDALYILSANLLLKNNVNEGLKIFEEALKINIKIVDKYIDLFENNDLINKSLKDYKNKN